MTKFIIWITNHPDVVVSFNKNQILNSLCVKMRTERFVISYAFDDLEFPWLADEDHFIEILNELYYKLNNKKEENDENNRS